MARKTDLSEGDQVEGTFLEFIEYTGRYITPKGAKSRMGKFRCECGNIVESVVSRVVSKNTKSCGCWNQKQRSITGKMSKTHGLADSPTSATYSGMIQRCHNPNHKSYPNYGEIGITVCDRWRIDPNNQGVGFRNFLEDMGERPEGKTLDRKDGSKGYYKENCRWVDIRTQTLNKKAHKTNKLGIQGVRIDREDENGPVYRAHITVNGKFKHLIVTRDLELAEFCREEAEHHYWGISKNMLSED